MAVIRVLVVSDNPDDIHRIETLLASQNGTGPRYVVASVDNWQAAIRVLVRNDFDVYIVDYWIPGAGPSRTGMDLIREVNAGGCHSPIIVLSSMPDEEIEWAVEDAGASDYLNKHDLHFHPDCAGDLGSEASRRILTRAIRYAIRHYQALNDIQRQLVAIRSEFASINRKLRRS